MKKQEAGMYLGGRKKEGNNYFLVYRASLPKIENAYFIIIHRVEPHRFTHLHRLVGK